MMFDYVFPHISHISQVLQAIEGRPEFFVKEGDRHSIVNYHVATSDTFPDVMVDDEYNYAHAVLRECRGIVFGERGEIISRRFHKFFNLNERAEVAYDKVDLTHPHSILDKLDGSMITPIRIGDHTRWGTKMGLTGVGAQAELFVSTRKNYLDFANDFREHTPIFEWCSRKQRIVVDYPHDKLVLTAVRKNVTGEYMSMKLLRAWGKEYDIPVVDELVLDKEAWTDSKLFSATASTEENCEGYVVRFDTGGMVKVKNHWYVTIHRAKDNLTQEKRVVEMIMTEKVDDVLPFLLEHDKKALDQFTQDFWKEFLSTTAEIQRLYTEYYQEFSGVKKDFAIKVAPNLPNGVRSTIFAIWGDEDEHAAAYHLRKLVQKNMGSASNIESVRWVWNNRRWADYFTQEDEDVGSS